MAVGAEGVVDAQILATAGTPTMWSVARIGVMVAKPEMKMRRRMRWVELLDKLTTDYD